MSRKVLHICLSSGWGGLEMYPSRIIPELARQGWQAYGLALDHSRVATSLEQAGVRVRGVASRARALLAARRLTRWLTAEDIRVVHCHKSSDLRLGALLKALQPGLQLFFTDHMGVTRPKRDPYHRWAYGKLTRLFSISDTTRARNLAAFPLPASRICRLYLGIDPAPYAPRLDTAARQALRRTLGIADGTFVIGLPGRLTPGKGQAVVIEALAALDPAWRQRMHLVVVGGREADEGARPGYVAELDAQVARHGLDTQVTFTGFRDDLPRLFEVFDVVCVPSRNEAFGLTVIEAMAAGKVVIGADSGAIPELLGGCGRLADPQSPPAWAEALRALASDPTLCEALARSARERMHRTFTLQDHVRGLTACYADATRTAGAGD